MKKSEIKVGEDYAQGISLRSGMSRVRVVDVGIDRVVGYGRSARVVPDGVRVLLLSADGETRIVSHTGAPAEALVPSRQIHWTWDAELARRARVEDAYQKRAAREQEFEERRKALRERLGLSWISGSAVDMTVEISISVLEDLLDRAEVSR